MDGSPSASMMRANPAYFPLPVPHGTTTAKSLVNNHQRIVCSLSEAVSNNREAAAQPYSHQSVSSS